MNVKNLAALVGTLSLSALASGCATREGGGPGPRDHPGEGHAGLVRRGLLRREWLLGCEERLDREARERRDHHPRERRDHHP